MCYRNKLVAIGVGALVAVSLACLGATLDGLAPRGSTLGFVVRTVPLALAIPLLMVAFNFLCDKWERHEDRKVADRACQAARDPALTDNGAGRVVGRVTRVENYGLPVSDGLFAIRGSRFSHSPQDLIPPARRWGGQ